MQTSFKNQRQKKKEAEKEEEEANSRKAHKINIEMNITHISTTFWQKKIMFSYHVHGISISISINNPYCVWCGWWCVCVALMPW